MSNMRKLPVMLVAAAVLAACDDGGTGVEAPRVFQWQGTLAGQAGFETLVGTAGFVWLEGTNQFVATATLFGDAAAAVRPWHVHHNTCAQGGGIVGSDADYPRLVIGSTGAASVSASVPTAVDAGASFHVNVHLSEEEMGTIIACADLSRVGGG